MRKACDVNAFGVIDGKSDDSRIVIADSGSTDQTHTILENLKTSRYPKIEILSNTNQYHGPKLIALYDYAIRHGADYIFQTDSDGQTNPDESDSFWTMRTKYDGIFGNRTVRGDGKDRAELCSAEYHDGYLFHLLSREDGF